MSKDSTTTAPEHEKPIQGEPKNQAGQKGEPKKTPALQKPKLPKIQTSNKEEENRIIRILNEQEKMIKNLSKNIDRQSKEIRNLEIQIRALQKQTSAIDKTLEDTVTFIKNRGWKKKKK
jgi:uncharacterized coiled-coil protein SlyX